MFGNLSPISHYYNHSLYRVPLTRDGDKYIIYVADNFVRNFTNETLPDEIKIKLGMIVAPSTTDVRDCVVYNSDFYIPMHPINGFDEIGWQVSDSYFCICMSRELLEELRGENDPRRESKRQGQESA